MPDSAQVEQELKQRQGVAKEDTLPPVENRDLQYVPPTTQVLYAPPKVTLRQKIFTPLAHYTGLFLPEIIIFAIFAIVFVFSLNYFNFIPLSTNYQKTFGILPHRYDPAGNNKLLAGVEYSSEIDGYELEGSFYGIRGERILIEYKGNVAEFLRADRFSCNTERISKISGTQEEILSRPAFCSDLLTDKSKGKNAYITFKRSSGGLNYIDFIVIKE
jgi:hypothetical protein